MQIPKINWDSKEVDEYIKNEKPVILLNCPLAVPATNRWTPEYLSTIISPSFNSITFFLTF